MVGSSTGLSTFFSAHESDFAEALLRNVTTLAGRHPEPQAGTRPNPPDPARSREKAPQAAICLDPFHVVMWGTKALDRVRRRTLEQTGDRDRNARWAVLKNPGAPRGARSYSRCSRERLEEISLGPMTYLDTERRRGQQHVRKLVTVSRYRNGAPGDPRDMAKAGLLESQFPAMQLDIRRKVEVPPVQRTVGPAYSGVR